MKIITFQIPSFIINIILFFKRITTPKPPIKTEEELDHEFNFHFDVANKRDIFEFIDKCRDTQYVSIGEESHCKCHKVVFIMDSRTGEVKHQLQMTKNQAEWFKMHIQSFIPMKNVRES